MTTVDLAAMAKLGVIDDDAIDDSALEDDEELLADLAALGGGPPPPVTKTPAMLRTEALSLKREALALKRAGQAQEAVLKLREAKAKESEAAEAEVQRRALPAMEAIAQVTLPKVDDEPVAIGGLSLDDDDDPDLAAEMAALAGEEEPPRRRPPQTPPPQQREATPATTPPPPKRTTSPPPPKPPQTEAAPSAPSESDEALALKRRAIALKRAGDLEGAITCLKRAKALEASRGALERVAEVRASQTKRDLEKEWRAYVGALETAMKGAVADAKRRLADGDGEGAKKTTRRARELKSMLEAASMSSSSSSSQQTPPTYKVVDVTEAAPRLLRDVPEDKAFVRLSKVRFPFADKQAKASPFTKVKFRYEFGGQAQGETDLVDLVQHGTWLACESDVKFEVTLDAALVASRRLLKKIKVSGDDDDASTTKTLPEKRRLEVAKRTASKFARAKLQVDALVVQGGLVGGLFGRREVVAARAKVALDPLLSRASLSDTAKLRADPEAPPLLSKGGQADVEIRLRGALRDPEIVDVLCRQDVVVLGDLDDDDDDDLESSKRPRQPVSAAPPAAARPPEDECRDPHAPTLLLSDRVLDHEIALADKGDKNHAAGDIAATARRLALATASQLLVNEVNAGKLTPAAYGHRVAKRRDADLILAKWLQANGRPHDANRVRNRVALVDNELKELRDAGEL